MTKDAPHRPAPALPVLLALLLCTPVPAGAAAWLRTYGGSGADEAFEIRPTSDGGSIVAGRTTSFGAGNDDGWLLKLDSAGNVQWQRAYGGTWGERFHAVWPTSDGGYIATGFQGSFTAAFPGNESLWVVKVTSSGTVQWERTLGGTASVEEGFAVRQLATGRYLVAGRTGSFASGNVSDGWLVELDPNGNPTWDQTYDFNSGTDAFYDVDLRPGGGYLLAGETDGHGSPVLGDNDFFVISVNAVGGIIQGWHAGGAVANTTGDSARSIQATRDGGYILAGETVQGSGPFDFWIVKVNASGNPQWQRYLGAGAFFSHARAVEETLDGGFIVAGDRALSLSSGVLLKLDAQGNQQWIREYTSPNGFADLRDVRQAPDGGFLAAGSSDASGSLDVLVVKTDPNGGVNPGCASVSVPSMTLANPGPLLPTPAGLAPPPVSHAASATSASTAATGATVIHRCPLQKRVNQDATTDSQQEVSLAVVPGNAAAQVAAYVDDPDPATSGGPPMPDIGVSFTTDGGASWTDRQVGFGCDGVDDDLDGATDEETLCDGLDDDFDLLVDEDPCCQLEHFHPTALADLAGAFYTGYLAQDPNAVFGAGTSVIGAARSTDGGSTWTGLPPAVMEPFGPDLLPPLGVPDPVFNLDNPRFAVERSPLTPALAALMAVWQREDTFSTVDTEVFAASLAPGAASWSTPVQVNDQPSMCSEDPVPSWSGGNLYVAWRQGGQPCGFTPQIYVDVSLDNGVSFNAFGPDLPGPVYFQRGALRNHTFQPSDRFAFAADPLNAAVLYLAYVEHSQGLDEANIMFTSSLDGGNSWLAPVKVNDDSTVTPQYLPAITVKVNANAWTLVDVVWYDERNSIGCNGLDDDFDGIADEELQNGLDDDGDFMIDEDLCDIRVDVYMARTASTAGPPILFGPNVRVTGVSSTAPGTPFPGTLGEQLGAGSDPLRTYVAWRDGRNGDSDIFHDTVTDLDSDLDLLADGMDCAPGDPTIRLQPTVVQNIVLSAPAAGSVTVQWASQDPLAGSATRYDIVSGLLSQLATDGDYRSSSCLADDHPDTPYVDTRAAPPPGDAYYYVLRAVNACGSGTFGPSSPTDPRVGLEDGAASLPFPDPCP